MRDRGARMPRPACRSRTSYGARHPRGASHHSGASPGADKLLPYGRSSSPPGEAPRAPSAEPFPRLSRNRVSSRRGAAGAERRAVPTALPEPRLLPARRRRRRAPFEVRDRPRSRSTVRMSRGSESARTPHGATRSHHTESQLPLFKKAERVGFEPTVRGLPAHTLSKRAPSASRTPLQADPRLLGKTIARHPREFLSTCQTTSRRADAG